MGSKGDPGYKEGSLIPLLGKLLVSGTSVMTQGRAWLTAEWEVAPHYTIF